MAKRLSDSNKWDDPWFAELPNQYKLLWIFILDKCDHAGIYKVNKKMAEFCIGCKFDWSERGIQGVFKGRLYPLNDEKWFIPKFVNFQYGELTSANRMHNSVMAMLKKEGVLKLLRYPVIGVKRKDKDKDKEQDKGKQFNEIWQKYPNSDGRKDALRHFNISVKTEQDWQDINKALKNYLESERVKNGYVKNGSTWFNNWKDWIDYKETVKEQDDGVSNLTPSARAQLKAEGKL